MCRGAFIGAVAAVAAALGCGRGSRTGGMTPPTPPSATIATTGTPACGGGWCWQNFPRGAEALEPAWGSAPDDLWVGGTLGAMLHFDGSGWTATWLGFRTFRAMWGTSRSDAWALDGAGAMLHWDGTSWREVAARAPCADVIDGFSASGGIAWCALDGPRLARFDGQRWETVALPAELDGLSPTAVAGVWAARGDDVFVSVTEAPADPSVYPSPMGILRWTAGQWTAYAVAGLREMTGSGPEDVWATADSSFSLWHFDGARWAQTDVLGPVFVAAPRDLWGVWFGMGSGRFHWVDGVATRLDDQPVFDLWSFGRDDVWGSGLARAPWAIVHWDGARWSPSVDLAGAGMPDLPDRDALTPAGIPQPPGGASVSWVARSGLAFALGSRKIGDVGDGLFQDVIWRWDGQGWTAALAGATWQLVLSTLYREGGVASMWGARADDAWASGAAAYHWDGARWTMVGGGPIHAPCIWGVTADDVWASLLGRGDPHQAWHWNGRTWTLVDEPVHLACGSGSSAYASDGTVWQRDPACR